MRKKRVVVGLSGGVDSSVASYLMQKQGYEVIGVFMRNWDPLVNNEFPSVKGSQLNKCDAEKDWQDVKAVGKQLGIPVFRENFVAEYWKEVFVPMVKTYRQGLTPNPDVLCNKKIKFGIFLSVVKSKYKASYLVTGHYAQTKNGSLYKGVDTRKDQSYFLAKLSQEQLLQTKFPLGTFTKAQVRLLARKLNLKTANKKDSTGVCFIGKKNFQSFLQNYISPSPGPIVSVVSQRKIGVHKGCFYYTIGQRHGLNLGGQAEPHYVAGKNVANNILYVTPRSHLLDLRSTTCSLKDVSFIREQPCLKTALTVKCRYLQKEVLGRLSQKNGVYYVHYPSGIDAVAPGQTCVIYCKNECLGAGTIWQVYRENKLMTFTDDKF